MLSSFNNMQQKIVDLDYNSSFIVLGLPSTGKTTILMRRCAEALKASSMKTSSDDVKIIVPSRVQADYLQKEFENILSIPFQFRVSTITSFVYEIVRRYESDKPRVLLTADKFDFILKSILVFDEENELYQNWLAKDETLRNKLLAIDWPSNFSNDLRSTLSFRSYIRDFLSLFMENSLNADLVYSLGDKFGIEIWKQIAQVYELFLEARNIFYPNALYSPELIGLAKKIIIDNNLIYKQIFVDDIQDLPYSAVEFLIFLQQRGSVLSLFCCPETATAGFRDSSNEALSLIKNTIDKVFYLDISYRGNQDIHNLQTKLCSHIGSSVFINHRKNTFSGSAHYQTAGCAASASAVDAKQNHATERVIAADVKTEAKAKTQSIAHPATTLKNASTKHNLNFHIANSSHSYWSSISRKIKETYWGLDSYIDSLDDLDNLAKFDDKKPQNRYSDIVLVARNRQSIVKALSELEKYGIPAFELGGGYNFLQSNTITAIISTICYIYDSESLNAKQFIDIFFTPVVGYSQKEFQDFLQKNNIIEIDDLSIEDFLKIFTNLKDQNIKKNSSQYKAHRFSKFIHDKTLINLQPKELLWRVWEFLLVDLELEALNISDISNADINSFTNYGEFCRFMALHSNKKVIREKYHKFLDLVMALFFIVDRYQNNNIYDSSEFLFKQLLDGDVPEDTVALNGIRDAVIVTTAQNIVGRQFKHVILFDVQEGIWPNLKNRNNLLKIELFKSLVNNNFDYERGMNAVLDSKITTLHDETRLFLSAISKAENSVNVFAIDNDVKEKSRFSVLFAEENINFDTDIDINPQNIYAVARAKAEHLLSLRNTQSASDQSLNNKLSQNLSIMALIEKLDISSYSKNKWYGILPESNKSDSAITSDENFSVSPSQIERAEQCSLNWAVSYFSGGSKSVDSVLGNIIHKILENEPESDFSCWQNILEQELENIKYESEWHKKIVYNKAINILHKAADYRRDQMNSGYRVYLQERRFSFEINNIKLNGVMDVVEANDDNKEIIVVDYKTGKLSLNEEEIENNAQLLSYQIALLEDESIYKENILRDYKIMGAQLVSFNPKQAKKNIFFQQSVTPEKIAAFTSERFANFIDKISGPKYQFEPASHCSVVYGRSDCKLHATPPISYKKMFNTGGEG